jgi:hypothetical protein
MDVRPVGAGPDAGKGTERTEVGERVVAAVSLGVDVGSVVVERLLSGHRKTITLSADSSADDAGARSFQR